MDNKRIAHYHLPGLFEFYDFYLKFLPIYKIHPEYFYSFCDIASIYDAPIGCIWGGGRIGLGDCNPTRAIKLINDYNISVRLTFSNSLLKEEHLNDKKCNDLCKLISVSNVQNGIIVSSDLLINHLKENYPSLYLVSSTTKVQVEFNDLISEINREDFKYVVPDFRHNKSIELLDSLEQRQKDKVEFLCNECCSINCTRRKECYENVSKKSLGYDVEDFVCLSQGGKDGYKFSRAMANKSFIGLEDIQNIYLKKGFSNFKIEGRGLGNAMLLEFILYYMVRPEYQIHVREEMYLDSMLDLF